MTQSDNALRRDDWCVMDAPIGLARRIVSEYHYAGRASNTATFCHGLFRRSDLACFGVAWWIPPTRHAAQAAYPQDWRRVLSLSRLVIVPDAPKNGASFLIAGSIRLIEASGRWDCLLTYADQRQGHTGAIYRATNWEYLGLTAPEATFVDGQGRMVARKAGHRTRTRAEMEALGYVMVGRFAKHRFRMMLGGRGCARGSGAASFRASRRSNVVPGARQEGRRNEHWRDS